MGRAPPSELPAAINALDNAWSASHNDHYRTVYYTERVKDSDGNVQTQTIKITVGAGKPDAKPDAAKSGATDL